MDKSALTKSLNPCRFENRLMQHNWTFTLGLGLVLNNVPSFDITKRHINKCYLNAGIINVSFGAAFLI